MNARTLGGEVVAVLAGTGRRLAGAPLPSAAATLTYYSGIAVVPWLLLALWTTTWTSTRAAARARLLDLQVLVPPDMGGRGPWRQLVEAATGMHLLVAAVLVFGASFYGEGLRRACLLLGRVSQLEVDACVVQARDGEAPARRQTGRLSSVRQRCQRVIWAAQAPPGVGRHALAPAPARTRWTGWRGRLLVLPLLALLPVVTAAVLAVGDRLAPLSPGGGGGGLGSLVVRVLVGFTALWLALTLPFAWLLRGAAPAAIGWRAALLGGTLTAASLAGFLHGFQLFLSFPLDVGAPFAGLRVVGGVLAVAFWLYVLSTVVLVGWVFTRELDERLRS